MPTNVSIYDLLGLITGFIFTILVFSYLVGDNPLFWFTIYLFIGVASGFAAAVIFHNVILDQLIFPLLFERRLAILSLAPPLLLGLWLLMKLSPRLAPLGNPVMAYLVGAAAATIIGGGILGTLFPQISATTSLFDIRLAMESGMNAGGFLLNGIIILFGTLTTLVYFQFGLKPGPERVAQFAPLVSEARRVGQVFIAVTFGAFFAGVYVAALSALIGRISFIIDFFRTFLRF